MGKGRKNTKHEKYVNISKEELRAIFDYEWIELPYTEKQGYMVAFKSKGYDTCFYYNYRREEGKVRLLKWKLTTGDKVGVISDKAAVSIYNSILRIGHDKVVDRQAGLHFFPIEYDEDALYFGPKTFVVKSNDYTCRLKEHKITDINAVAMVLDKSNNIVEYRVAAAFCQACDLFYITPYSFDQLKKNGVPLFQVEDKLKQRSTKNSYFDDFATESVLRKLGYTVSQTEGLSTPQRHSLLTIIMRSGILNRWEIIEHIEQLINLNGSAYSRSMETAVSKWENDLSFLNQYNDNYKDVTIEKIINRKYYENYRSCKRHKRVTFIF